MISAPRPVSKTATASSLRSASRKQMSRRCAPRSRICGLMRRAGGLANGPRSRENILKRGNSLLASFAYGFAIFPCLANEARRKAQQNQLECYLKAAASFPVKFERRILAIPYQSGTVTTPVHLFSVTRQYASAPVL